jgi:hypothetical protein
MLRILLIVKLLSLFVLAEDVVLSEVLDFERNTLTRWTMRPEQFSEEPRWTGNGSPPLPLEAAIAVAKSSIEKGHASRSFRLRSVSLRPPVKGAHIYPERYVYIIEFEADGKVVHTLVVAMSGKVASSTTEALRK